MNSPPASGAFLDAHAAPPKAVCGTPDARPDEVLPRIQMISVNCEEASYQKRGMFVEITRIDIGRFYPNLAKAGKFLWLSSLPYLE
jgi:hypothetical protein